MVLSESQSRRQRRLGMEHTNFQAQAGTALRYEHDQSQVTQSRLEAYENSSLWEVPNCGDQRVLDVD
jgi:hypothetical protein